MNCPYTKQTCNFDIFSDICNSCARITREEIVKQCRDLKEHSPREFEDIKPFVKHLLP